MNNKVMK